MATLSLHDAETLATKAFLAAGLPPATALTVARALIAAEADGLASHGLMRLPYYADQALSGKVKAAAEPRLERKAPAAIHVDANEGFAYPAIALALEEGGRIARDQGIAIAAISNSHHAGAIGHHVEAAAQKGLLALAFANTQAAIAPWGGRKALYGTNPIAFASPRHNAPPLVVDLSVSTVARGKVMVAKTKGEPIPLGWALDAEGNPTTDATAAMQGTMLPFGDAKGACLALMVEILAGALTGANFSHETGSMFEAKGAPPHLGQLFILIDPTKLGGAGFLDRIEVLIAAILQQDGTRLPGDRRLSLRAKAAVEGLVLPDDLLAELRRRAEG